MLARHGETAVGTFMRETYRTTEGWSKLRREHSPEMEAAVPMSKMIRNIVCSLAAVLVLGAHGTVLAQAREEAKLLVATEVLDELRGQRDQQIPESLLQRAYGVAVIPDVLKGAFFVGARHGTGVMSVRDSRGRFSNPVFVQLTGGSLGFQFGAQATDIVLVFTTRRGVEGIASGKLTLGAGASVAAGPLGRQAEAAASVDAEIYAYSRARGLFAGVALDGTALTIDAKANRNFYNKKDVLPSDITSGVATSSSENTRRFLASLALSTGETADGAGVAAAPGNQPLAPVDHSAHPGAGEVQTFPMEDPAPGKEPR
jgi:lipid-binding SYLF domain-containing protein